MVFGSPNFSGANKGIKKAASKCHPYIEDAVAYIMLIYKSGSIVAWDEMRRQIEDYLGPIPSHNCWGAVSRNLTEANFMEETGVMVHSRNKLCHARKVPQYRII